MKGSETVPTNPPLFSDNPPSVESAPLPERVPGAPLFGNTFQFLSDTTGLIAQSYKRFGPVVQLRALWLKYTVIPYALPADPVAGPVVLSTDKIGFEKLVSGMADSRTDLAAALMKCLQGERRN
jgi:hypothetical protein